MDVAPRAGAWIETPTPARTYAGKASRPARARGLKLRQRGTRGSAYHVAPRAGAWIETLVSACTIAAV